MPIEHLFKKKGIKTPQFQNCEGKKKLLNLALQENRQETYWAREKKEVDKRKIL